MTVRHNTFAGALEWASTYMQRPVAGYSNPAGISTSKRLRLVLRDVVTEMDSEGELKCYFGDSNMPALEVLELDTQGSLYLCIEKYLKVLVVIAANRLHINMHAICYDVGLTQMFVQSGHHYDFWPTYKNSVQMQQASLAIGHTMLVSLPEYVRASKVVGEHVGLPASSLEVC